MLVHPRVTPSIKFASTHLYTWVERGTVEESCLLIALLIARYSFFFCSFMNNLLIKWFGVYSNQLSSRTALECALHCDSTVVLILEAWKNFLLVPNQALENNYYCCRGRNMLIFSPFNFRHKSKSKSLLLPLENFQ